MQCLYTVGDIVNLWEILDKNHWVWIEWKELGERTVIQINKNNGHWEVEKLLDAI